MRALVELLPLLVWAFLCLVGGWGLAASLFHLRRNEAPLVGLAIGLILQTWLANLLAHLLPLMAASWAAAIAICVAGLTSAYRLRGRLQLELSWPLWVLLGILFLLFTSIGRGLGIFDDYQNLPTISLMATGDVPPHFALNPALNFGYHYFLLLLSAQVMRLGHMFPWTALDVARGLIMALPLVLAGLWAYRVTRSQMAAVLTGAMLALAGGARWLLLLLPPAWLSHISDNITLIGSASTSAGSLAEAMITTWKIDGAGPLPFPFAFYTGINQPYVMAYTGISGSGILILLVLLLAANRRRHWAAGVVVSALIAALALANEIAFLLIMLGFGIVALTWIFHHRSWRLPRELAIWIGILAASVVLAAVQGGLLTEILRSRFFAAQAQSGYFDTSLVLTWPPAVISAHLGALSLANPAQLLAALAEIGPVVLVTPLIILWARRSYRLGNWYEAALIASSAGAILALFIAFKGPLYTATPRLMSGWFFACVLYAVPLLWVWGRTKSGSMQAAAATVAFAACLGGLVLFGVQLLAIQKPVLSTFISPMDARMAQDYWNRLAPDALILDPVVSRAPTVFGRFTVSSPSWYSSDPAWQALIASPDPTKMRSAGFSYFYYDRDYWDRLDSTAQALLTSSCVKQIAEVDGIHSEQDYSKDFRRLIDIKKCK
jgi:hypothetical protein